MVTDEKTGEELIGVSVSVNDSEGTTTEFEEGYALFLNDGTYKITFSYVGYKDAVRELTIAGEPEITMDVILEEESEVLEIITVTGSRTEKNITKEATSIEVIRPEFIERNANTDLSQVVERVPGVQIVDGQANIRSGSGFAYGAGSRVAVVVDEQPLLSAELSDVKWNFIPLENAAQIEIIKGSASVLYGSGGLNGVINVRTAQATSDPYTKLSLYSGMHFIPDENGRRWYAGGIDEDGNQVDGAEWRRDSVGMRPFIAGLYFAHREKIGENFDLVLGSNIHLQQGFLQSDKEYRYRFNWNTKYRLPKNEKVAIGVNGNLMFHRRTDFFIWADGYENAYYHIENLGNGFAYWTLSLDPYLTAFDGANNKHSVKLRYFFIKKKVRQGSPTAVYSGEYQFQREVEEKDLVITGGVSNQFFFAESNLFGDSTAIVGLDTFQVFNTETANLTSAYVQLDKGFMEERLNTTLGARLEYINVSGLDQARAIPVFRGGASYAVSEKDFVRTSFGQGFRFPSLAEQYIDDDITEGINVYPNPELKPETGFSAEIGYKRAFGSNKEGGWKGFVDASVFMMEYRDLIEFQFGLYRPEGVEGDTTLNDLLTHLGFKSTNVSRARIAGFEVSSFGEGKIGTVPARFTAGYTYSYPGDLSDDPEQAKAGVFIKNMVDAFILPAGDSLSNSMLNFRALHLGRLDFEVDVNDFTFGMAANYNGFMYNIDDFFKGEGDLVETVMAVRDDVRNIIESLSVFRDQRTAGDWVFDVRASYNFGEKNRVDVMVNNVLNREYSIRPLKMSAPLSLNLRYSREF